MHIMRAFIAVEIPLEVKQNLLEEIDRLRVLIRGQTVRWVKPAGIHLTLKFLGEITAEQVGEISKVLEREIDRLSSFTLDVGGFGCFPNNRRPRVLWIGITGETDPLLKAQSVIEENLVSLGFDHERRPFRPHLTLGRVRRNLSFSDFSRIEDAMGSFEVGQVGQFKVSELYLIRSTLKPTGAEYSNLGEYRMGR